MALVYAKRSCGVGRKRGGITFVSEGQAFDDQHALVKERPDLFASEPPASSVGRGGVERATRAPGEQRATPAPTTRPSP